MEFNQSAKEFIQKYSKPGSQWGLTLDFLDNKEIKKNIPYKYRRFDFYEMDHDRIEKFFNMSNEEKFLVAYWSQRLHGKKAFGYGFIVGIVLVIFILLSFISL
jgi:hypothetical protein